MIVSKTRKTIVNIQANTLSTAIKKARLQGYKWPPTRAVKKQGIWTLTFVNCGVQS